MRQAITDQAPRRHEPTTDQFDVWLDAFANADTDDALDRQLFAIRESLIDFRSL